jgi:PhzF family phenazine biosynthesis protein
MPDQLTIVDAFTNSPFAGNPAAVCLLDAPRDPEWLQCVAREVNMPATAFIAAEGDAYHLRWFSPTTELALCGRGTLASAHFLWSAGLATTDSPLRFHTVSGELTCRRADDWVAMDFPAEIAQPVASPPDGLIAALGVEPIAVLRNRLDYLIELADAAAVRAIQPDAAQLLTIQTRGVIVTAPAESADHDFVSRFFAPSAGLLEDAATGSAHCALGPYWSARLSKAELTGRQLSARGAAIRVRVGQDRVELLGQAVTVLRGQLLLYPLC